jgi:hypothetical protein
VTRDPVRAEAVARRESAKDGYAHAQDGRLRILRAVECGLYAGTQLQRALLADRAEAAWQAVTQAGANAEAAAPVEHALIAALAKRYKGPEYVDPPGMQPYNEAYAAAMREVAHKFAETSTCRFCMPRRC